MKIRPEDQFVVENFYQTLFSIDDEDQDVSRPKVSEETLEEMIDLKLFGEHPIGQGATKEVFKVSGSYECHKSLRFFQLQTIDTGSLFAAKRYIASDLSLSVDLNENYELINQEVIRTMQARNITRAFCRAAIDNDVSIHGMFFEFQVTYFLRFIRSKVSKTFHSS